LHLAIVEPMYQYGIMYLAKVFIQMWLCCMLLLPSALIWADAVKTDAAAVVSAHPLATQAGEAILAQGGNAFDAAVAVTAALAVVEPYASGLGGGGFWLLHRAKDRRDIMIDGREMAPGNASSTMYLDETGQPIKGASLNGPAAAAIPGTPAALVHITKKYGRLSLAQNLAPAITLARAGFKLDERFARTLKHHQEKLLRNQAAAQVFLNNGRAPAAGTLLRQPQLAATLSTLAKQGANGFYKGAVAHDMVRAVRQAGGIWRHDDLSQYRVVEREPIKFTYREAQITSAALPSAGGLSLAQGLNILEHFAIAEMNAWNRAHLIAEVLRFVYKDRVALLGDSDFVSVPEQRLLSKDYARQRAALIDMDKSGVSVGVNAQVPSSEGSETTHFSVIDQAGNRVAATMSINTFFGSSFVAGNTGVLLNNEMDDFSLGEHVPNIFGLYGSKANMISPGKRPLSSMSPTFVENERGILIVGTPGGSRIISMLLLVIMDFVDNAQTDPEQLVSGPRLHHQYLPDQILVEPDAYNQAWHNQLQLKGHLVKTASRRWGNMQLIYFDKKNQQSYVASDPRGSSDTRY
jgi:gamma-glutamyltranspeptidase / glutathione hydrolase